MDTPSTIQSGISSYICTAAPCLPLSFVATFYFTDLVDSCSSCPLLSVSLNSAIVRFILHTTGLSFACQCNITVARDKYLFFLPLDKRKPSTINN